MDSSTAQSRSNFRGFATGDAQEFVVARGEDVVRVAARGPDDVVLCQGHVDDGAQWLGVSDGGDATCGLCNPPYIPTAAACPPVSCRSSAYVVGKTKWLWPPAAQTSSYWPRSTSTSVRMGAGKPRGATPLVVRAPRS